VPAVLWRRPDTRGPVFSGVGDRWPVRRRRRRGRRRRSTAPIPGYPLAPFPRIDVVRI